MCGVGTSTPQKDGRLWRWLKIVMRIGSEVWRNESKPTDLVKRSGVLMEVPPTQMSTLSGIQAERRAVRAKMQASEDNEAARRGRRGSVVEDVPSENGGNRLGYGSRFPSGVTYDPTIEVTRQEDVQVARRSLRI
ncbi:hypothetical protein PC129_g5168 [Phytophthora cactorum]|uniref:Uncharacterized protein n=1 Tax=Phytophthora cactorum TaxID=29920 RepID=A0A329SBP5_9STRA|nr:hypothetical protein Pcac1_g18183 [Phytophthora cactorum]KAG2824911.1 hypothetical protein PC111_g9607 [Phytophthora cactorum]KAG2842286.1 hypothetical protein PC112_g3061 [Phytophthora cactorum]KAG2861365.1 hypothetical protein PC113_g7264 [Phytophthora cactorum]KAG2922718.1 hypothetical protein PC114_g5148 [Phytophthora cactorum]